MPETAATIDLFIDCPDGRLMDKDGNPVLWPLRRMLREIPGFDWFMETIGIVVDDPLALVAVVERISRWLTLWAKVKRYHVSFGPQVVMNLRARLLQAVQHMRHPELLAETGGIFLFKIQSQKQSGFHIMDSDFLAQIFVDCPAR